MRIEKVTLVGYKPPMLVGASGIRYSPKYYVVDYRTKGIYVKPKSWNCEPSKPVDTFVRFV